MGADRTPAEPRPAPPRQPARRDAPSPVGLLVVATAALVAVLVTFGIFLPALAALGEAATRDPATLPERISICDREWRRDPLARQLTRDEVFARTEAEPIVVDVSVFAACPAAVGATDGTVGTIYVRTGEDAFVGYELAADP